MIFPSYQIIASGLDPHTYKPLARDTRRLQRAILILYNGFSFRGKFE